ncbi:kinesin-domain-containing protein [Guyanagaster necrorhizus]|uniref:Kinesin-domain-containing protein n=1 Tax=Guyanagaster necrorhizus TaxID=856835 RepID=A0A9P7W0X2_9AGAR|nr:kinesin-domain-containing protein [Guyanagaster necrorhizus MCA 3950]KAG7450688.1 kinesin-domain-containing protein [Guyanagaster necrorhizus MCA 3950]
MASRLPRYRSSSPERTLMAPALKRKAQDQNDPPVRKILKPLSKSGVLSAPKPLTKPRPPALTTGTRATQISDLTKQLGEAKSQARDHLHALNLANDEIATLKRTHSMQVSELEYDIRKGQLQVEELDQDLQLARTEVQKLRESVSQLTSTGQDMQKQLNNKAEVIAALRTDVEALKSEAIDAESVRRQLHNTIQELKGNIRVFCRVRPDPSPELANVSYSKEKRDITVTSTSESATGQQRKDVHSFTFDRVFEPNATQAEVFEEVSQLAQSCTDGYNVCIFAYGQTGSGKSFTMEGGQTEEMAGMIPRAVDQVFRVTNDLKSRGWEYTLEGQFLEIYNETINDLLASSASVNAISLSSSSTQYNIKHDPQTRTTTVTNLTSMPLTSPTRVRTLLLQAQSRRSVASTLMNEYSSRSHSVFRVKIEGANETSGERCVGWLNLVDLAGSERLNVSFAGSVGPGAERLKETQNINKSLSSLGDVISALGEKGANGEKHVPYRNSKLTYLLQYSLSGSSKTLMILNLSPLAAHLNESLNSLRFATKVNNTTIGTAKSSKQGR